MTSCPKMIDAGRRKFLSGAGLAAAGMAAATVVPSPAESAPAPARVEYPSNRLANVRDLKPNEPLNVAYPDRDAPGVLLKLGTRVPTGVGPDGDIVGFSTICPHKGIPLSYNKSDHTLNCSGHYSRFDCDAGGQQIWGQATQNLPQYALDGNGDIYAEGVDELLYGRLSNVCRSHSDERKTLFSGRIFCGKPAPTFPENALREETMAYKRQIDRLPIIPKDAKEFNVTCHYCIVGCGYKAYSWPVNKQGGAAADQNKFGVDLGKQQPAETAAWYSPSMYNIVQQNGEDVHIVIKPDKDCVVNSGLGSVRGARMAEMSYSRARNTELQRLTDPMVWRYGQMQPTSWDDALDLVARVTVAVINDMGEDGLFVSAFDHGGAGGGYENTWGTGKLYFGAMKVKNIRIHNRPAYNSEVHATRDMGVGELNNCYEDAELADTIVAVGTNALETQTNYFLNHWVPNMRGTSMDKKRAEFGSEPVAAARVIIVDPRRTVTVNACEVEAGKDRVMHLAINSGTDLALFNAWLTYINEKGLTDKAFIAASTNDFDKAAAGNKTSLEEAAQITA